MSRGRQAIQGKYGDTLKIVAVDTSGKIIAVLQGDDSGTLRTVAIDSAGQLYTLIKGSLGETIAVDATGNLSAAMKGLDGATLRTVAVDGDGNIIGLMKGDYAGSLKTIATDAGGRMLVTPQYNNPATKNVAYIADSVAPHAASVQVVYTVPSGKAAVLYATQVRLRIATAAAAPGLRYAQILVSIGGTACNVVFVSLTSIFNTAKETEGASVSIGMPLATGDVVQLRTSDSSTGGTCDYVLVAAVMEYDV